VCVDVVLFLQDVREEEGARLMPWGGTAPSDGGVDSCEEEQAKAAHRGGQRQARLWGGEGEPQRRLGSPALGDEGYRIDGAEDSEFRPLSWPWRPTQWTGMCGRTKARAASSIVRPVENKVKTAKMNQDEGRDGKTRCEAEFGLSRRRTGEDGGHLTSGGARAHRAKGRRSGRMVVRIKIGTERKRNGEEESRLGGKRAVPPTPLKAVGSA